MISSSLLTTFVLILVVGCLCWLAWWLIGYIGLPAPFDKVLRVLVAIIAFIFLANLLLGLVGHPLFSGPILRS